MSRHLPPVPSVLVELDLVKYTRSFALRRSCTLAILSKVATGLASDASLADVVSSIRDHGALTDLFHAADTDEDSRLLWELAEAEDPDARMDLYFAEKSLSTDSAPPYHRWHAPCFLPTLASALESDDLARLESLAMDALQDDDELTLHALVSRVIAVAPSAADLQAVRERVKAEWKVLASAGAADDSPGECWTDALFDAIGAAGAAA